MIPGLTLLPDFITEPEEQTLTHFISTQPWRSDLKRRVQHYGYVYDYRARRVSADMYLGPLPEPLATIAGALHQQGLFARPPDQVIVNAYEPGQGIAPHIDCEPCFGPVIASLSLLSPVMMDFTGQGQRTSLYLEPRSLLVLSSAARYDFKHGIAGRKSDLINGQRVGRGRRVSLTFRTIASEFNIVATSQR